MRMIAKDKANELVYKFNDAIYNNLSNTGSGIECWELAKQCALIAVENEYNEKRELLYLLRVNRTIESEKVYLYHIQRLTDEEFEVKQEIEKLWKKCKSESERFLIAVLFDSGARIEEFLNIRYEDLQLPDKSSNYVKLTLKEEYSKTTGRVISLSWKHSTKNKSTG